LYSFIIIKITQIASSVNLRIADFVYVREA
jgi:hypothetical protein